MIEDIGKILKGTFFIIAGVAIFSLGMSLGYFGLGDIGDTSLSGAVTADTSSTTQCPEYKCELTQTGTCNLIKTEKLVDK